MVDDCGGEEARGWAGGKESAAEGGLGAVEERHVDELGLKGRWCLRLRGQRSWSLEVVMDELESVAEDNFKTVFDVEEDWVLGR